MRDHRGCKSARSLRDCPDCQPLTRNLYHDLNLQSVLSRRFEIKITTKNDGITTLPHSITSPLHNSPTSPLLKLFNSQFAICNLQFFIFLSVLLSSPTFAEILSPEQTLKKAQQLERDGKISRARDLYQSFLNDHPGHTQVLDAHYRLAKCLDSLGLVDEVVSHLEKVVNSKNKKYRHRRDVYYMLGKFHASLKEYDKAAAVFENMLGEGAGLYENEVLSLCGGYYAILKKYEEAGAKFNILRRRRDARLAETAALKLCMVWLKGKKLELAIEAIDYLAQNFPNNKQARGLMLQVANLFRKQRRFDKAVAVCEQIKARYPNSNEAKALGYVIGMCYRDSKKYQKAVETFDKIARLPETRKAGLAADSLLQSADILFSELEDTEKAMAHYQEAARFARDSKSQRRTKILEQCYFRLAEHYYAQKIWRIALDYYLLLKKLGTGVNVLPRIMKCQAEINQHINPTSLTPADVEYMKKKIAENPGTFAAAEGEIFLIDRQMASVLRQGIRGNYTVVIEQYESVIKKYSKEILSEQHLESYIYSQLGMANSQSKDKRRLLKGIAMFDKALACDSQTPYREQVLENIARSADWAGKKKLAFETYQNLFEISSRKLEKEKEDEQEKKRMSEFLRSMLSRADEGNTIDKALLTARTIQKKKGPFSDAARHSLYYIAELYYLKKDFSAAARTYKEFIIEYGPKQNGDGEIIGAPWKPAKIDEVVQQVYEASVRVAHCWYMQGHTRNMVVAYKWLVRNFSHLNKYLAEANYWLAIEGLKGKEGKKKENKRKVAEELWKKVVNPSLDFGDSSFRKNYHFWVRDAEMAKYSRSAIMKAGELYSELGEHHYAAQCFRTYLELYPPPGPGRNEPPPPPDEMLPIARYALGREYVALEDLTQLINTYKVYLDAHREDRFRISALRLLAYHADIGGATDIGIEAYGTILDEYGINDKDKNGKVIPVQHNQRLRRGRYNWNGIRKKPPKGLNLGQTRFALGYLYFKKEDWSYCAKVLHPFVTEPRLFDNKSRGKALYMLGQSYFNLYSYDKGLAAVTKLIEEHPKFEAIEEVYVFAARGCTATDQWKKIGELHKKFVDDHSESFHRPHMDLHNTIAMLKLGNSEAAGRLKGIAGSDTYEDVKADAWYHLGEHFMSQTPPDLDAALENLDRSVQLYPRESSCLAAAKCHIGRKEWDKANSMLGRTIRDFPIGDRRIISEAKKLLPNVLKEMAKQKKK